MVDSLRFALAIVSFLLSFGLDGQDSSTPVCDCLSRLEQELDSKEIKNEPCLKQLIKRIDDPEVLIDDLDNVDSSMVYSTCQSRHLTYGEVALVVMEHIERIPYFPALGIQNCTLAHCEDNPNLIEYFYAYWGDYTYDNLFGKYFEYLQSEKRQKHITYLNARDN